MRTEKTDSSFSANIYLAATHRLAIKSTKLGIVYNRMWTDRIAYVMTVATIVKKTCFKPKNTILYGLGNGCLAQLVEHRPYKARVIGSSPIVPTIIRSGSSVG